MNYHIKYMIVFDKSFKVQIFSRYECEVFVYRIDVRHQNIYRRTESFLNEQTEMMQLKQSRNPTFAVQSKRHFYK